jgi:hypothetical protein
MGLLLLAVAAAGLGLAGGIAYATTPLHIVSVEHGPGGYRPGIDYRVDGYRPRPIPAEQLPGYQNYVTPLKGTQPIDAHGVALQRYGARKVYHPLVIARYGIALLESYRITQNPAYLDRAKVNADWLINNAVSRGGALYFPYRFIYHLYGDPHDVLRPPWNSALPQGTALSLFMRLNAVTGDQKWRTAADSTFASFVKRQSAKQPWKVPWIVFVYQRNHHRYLWLEEAPKHPPDQVLNGFMYALFGLWEYAITTGSDAAAAVFDGGATTIRHQVQRFRVRGGISYYSLRVRAQYSSYHCLVVGQLKLLTTMTGDPWFAREGRRFGADGRHAHVHC